MKEDLPPLYNGQAVRILNKINKTWYPGTIIDKCDEPRSYLVETPNGTRLRRNRSHLREIIIPRRLLSSEATTSPGYVSDNQPSRHMDNSQNDFSNLDIHQKNPDTNQSTETNQTVPRRSGRITRIPSRYQE